MNSKSMKSKLTSSSLHAKENSMRGSYLTNTNKQMFMQENISKENDFRTNTYLKNRMRGEDSVTSRQYDVYKNKLERSRIKYNDDDDDVFERLRKQIPKDHRIRKIDPEKLILEKCTAAVTRAEDTSADNCCNTTSSDPFTNSHTNNSEYGWWLNMNDDAFSSVEAPTFGRKSIVKETFYRRNDAGNCMAV